MKKFDVILFADTAHFATKTRGYGVHRLASHIREQGYSCLVIDFTSLLKRDMYKEILNLAMGDNTVMVGFSTTFLPFRLPGTKPTTNTPDRPFRRDSDDDQFDNDESVFYNTLTTEFGHGNADDWILDIKQINPNTKVVMGGSGIGWYLDTLRVNNFFYGLAENMIVDYLNSITGKTKKRFFNRVLDYDYKSQLADWDFRQSTTQYTEYDFIKPYETLSLEIARGCRFECKFCSYPLIGQKNVNDYLKFEDVIYNELMENYSKWGITQYYIMDDTFNDSTEKLVMVKRAFDRLPFKVSFWCYLRLDLLAVHPEQIPLLKDMGLAQTYFGIETFHPEASKVIGKGMPAEKRKKALQLCKEVWGDDVHIQAGFMVGLPHEPEESIEKTAEYLRDPECPVNEAWIFPINIAPNIPELKYVYKSEFDINANKWGYSFATDVKKEYNWFKADNSGITSLLQATEIAGKWDGTVPKKMYKADFYRASLNHPILSNRQLTKQMSLAEYEKLVESIDQPALYHKTVMEDYFIPLLNKLKN
jgi:radical SAM superfamily enzyme YgiQ (UPF0313 family)